jgi:dTDP-4-dehydrorhamnose 3,5-epimerase-like enzyme
VRVTVNWRSLVRDVRTMTLPHFPDENGDLVVIEAMRHVPFTIERVFIVQAPLNAIRGQHAHRRCAQFMTCSRGSVEVLCDDGNETQAFVLDRGHLGLFVPPGIWAQQIYRHEGSVLTVLCDRPYEPDDYVREYDEFIGLRRTVSTVSSRHGGK